METSCTSRGYNMRWIQFKFLNIWMLNCMVRFDLHAIPISSEKRSINQTMLSLVVAYIFLKWNVVISDLRWNVRQNFSSFHICNNNNPSFNRLYRSQRKSKPFRNWKQWFFFRMTLTVELTTLGQNNLLFNRFRLIFLPIFLVNTNSKLGLRLRFPIKKQERNQKK